MHDVLTDLDGNPLSSRASFKHVHEEVEDELFICVLKVLSENVLEDIFRFLGLGWLFDVLLVELRLVCLFQPG